MAPVRYGFRSFDRQWIIPDNRLLNRPNPTLWETHSPKQVYLTALTRSSPASGPALTFTGLTPDLDHYHGRGGRAFPLWARRRRHAAQHPGGAAGACSARPTGALLAPRTCSPISPPSPPIPPTRAAFGQHLVQPGLRIPLTGDAALFAEAVALGREVVWLHTFGERFAAPAEGRPARAPRLPEGQGPSIPKDGAIPSGADEMPDVIDYDPGLRRLRIGSGHIDNVSPEVWAYEVSGKHVLTQWFSYRRRDRARPIIGDRRPPSPLGDIQPEGWLGRVHHGAAERPARPRPPGCAGAGAGGPARPVALNRPCGSQLRRHPATPAASTRRRPGRIRNSRQMKLLD